MTTADYVIIGGGMAGLYARYRLKQGGFSVYLFEAADRIGGRVKMVTWHETRLNLGAGVVRDTHDNIGRLCLELGLKINGPKPQHTVPSLTEPDLDLIREAYHQHKQEIIDLRLTFDQFLCQYFTPEFRQKMLQRSEFRDYLLAGVPETINWYPLDDFIADESAMIDGGWYPLQEKLLGEDQDGLFLNCPVVEVGEKYVKIKSGETYYARKGIILAVTLPALKRITFPLSFSERLETKTVYDYYAHRIGTIPFTRCYSHHEADLPKDLPDLTISTFPLQRIIPIKPHLLMAVYADGETAHYWKRLYDEGNSSCPDEDLEFHCNVEGKLIHQIQAMLRSQFPEQVIPPINDLIYQWWPLGIHYYKPSDQSPIITRLSSSVWVMGEMVSHNQGWVEGAIATVNDWLISQFGTIQLN